MVMPRKDIQCFWVVKIASVVSCLCSHGMCTRIVLETGLQVWETTDTTLVCCTTRNRVGTEQRTFAHLRQAASLWFLETMKAFSPRAIARK